MNTRLTLAVLALGVSGVANAATESWNQWDADNHGTITTGSGSVDVGFSGETGSGWYASYPSWQPSATWADGSVVANGPTGGIVRLTGGNANVQTITFSQAVVDPVISIWSLGQGGTTASFDFLNATPVFVAGGANAEYGGQAITVSGNVVSGNEGNGTVQFIGTFNSISWTNPLHEDWYGFNVGIAGAVPEPASTSLLLAGLALMGVAARRRRRMR